MKKKESSILFLIIWFLSVYFIYFGMGLLFNTDILNAITPNSGGGFTISFLGIILLFGTFYLGLYSLDKYSTKRRK